MENLVINIKLEGVEEVKSTIKELSDELLKLRTHCFSEKELHCMAYMIQGAICGNKCKCGVCKYAPDDITSCEVDLQVRKKLMDQTGVYLGVAQQEKTTVEESIKNEFVELTLIWIKEMKRYGVGHYQPEYIKEIRNNVDDILKIKMPDSFAEELARRIKDPRRGCY